MDHAERGLYPLDVVAPQHEQIDDDLNAWGRWNRERRRKRECGSIEHEHRSTGGRSYNAPDEHDFHIALPPNPRNVEIDKAVLHVPYDHQRCLKMHYVEMRMAWMICRKVKIPPGDFGHWMHDARCMVLNILRRQGLDTGLRRGAQSAPTT